MRRALGGGRPVGSSSLRRLAPQSSLSSVLRHTAQSQGSLSQGDLSVADSVWHTAQSYVSLSQETVSGFSHRQVSLKKLSERLIHDSSERKSQSVLARVSVSLGQGAAQ